MTTDIEQTFFNTFGIEPICKMDICTNGLNTCSEKNTDCKDCKFEQKNAPIYPEITDRRLLEIITSLANALCNYFVPCVDYYNLKSRVLYDLIQNKENEELQYNIQQLFKGEE